LKLLTFSTLRALGIYGLRVLCICSGFFVFYPTLLLIFAKVNPIKIFQSDARSIVSFLSTSSSAATLPVTMEDV
jgi:Na+/H+-dicarboxylate symporter